MLDRTVTKFSHVKPDDTQFRSDGLRDFFIYRDLGIAEATAGKVLARMMALDCPWRPATSRSSTRRSCTMAAKQPARSQRCIC